MDARDVCRRLNCSPMKLSEWVEMGCPVTRRPPFAHFDVDTVRKWLAENNIRDWPREGDRDLDSPVRVLLKALQARQITPWEAEKIILNLGSGVWG